MNSIEVAIACAINGLARLGLGDCGIGADRRRKLSSVDPFAVSGGLEKVFIVLETVTAGDAM